MSLRVVKHHLHLSGMPCTSRGGRAAQRACGMHDTEGGTGEQGAWNTISWMHATAATRNASYNEFWAVNEAARELLAIEVVPASHAAHSIAPQPISPSSGLPLYQPDAQVKAALGSVVWDPNMWVYAISVAGRVADVERYARMPWFVADARARLAQLAARGINTSNLLEHFRFNPRTRTDWGRSLVPALKGVVSDDMQFWKPVQEDWNTKIGARFWDGNGAEKAFTSSERVRSVAESSDGAFRLVRYGSSELLVMERVGLSPIAGTRIPAPGSYGFPPPETIVKTVEKVVEKVVEVPTGITEEDVQLAQQTAATAERNRIAAAEAARIKAT